jgi:hypothetical protein
MTIVQNTRDMAHKVLIYSQVETVFLRRGGSNIIPWITEY